VLAIAAISLAGITAIVGSGGVDPFEGICIEPSCSGPQPPSPFFLTVDPFRQVVPAGDTATFNARLTGATSVTYQWLRNGVEIAGATTQTYRLVGANVGDDGSQFSVRGTASDGRQAVAQPVLLRVSSAPGLKFADGSFAPSNWMTTIGFSDPAQNGPTFRETQQLSGGNPDAFLEIVYALPAGTASLHVLHADLASTYDPPRQGPLLVVDFAADCRLSTSVAKAQAWVYPLIEQGGRRFSHYERYDCGSWRPGEWGRSLQRVAVGPDEFSQLDGPDCGAVACKPDFSATGAPLRFGFGAVVYAPFDAAAGLTTLGIDNWTVTAWKK
jgi:hypothetical protein